MPYTCMYVAALGMGFGTSDLRTMPPDRLLWFVHCNNLNHGAKGEEPEFIEGTAEDLKKLL